MLLSYCKVILRRKDADEQESMLERIRASERQESVQQWELQEIDFFTEEKSPETQGEGKVSCDRSLLEKEKSTAS